jgi:hypothetical protein
VKKKHEFSKQIFIGVSVGTIIITALSFVLMFKFGDLSPLMYLIPAAFAELATATGFYYNKAKVENRIKLKQAYKQELLPEDFKEEQTDELYTNY